MIQKKKKIKDNYKIIGFVKKAKLNFFNQYKAKDLSFAFNVIKDEYLLTNIETNFNEIKYVSELIEVKKKNHSFLVKGNFIINRPLYSQDTILMIKSLKQSKVKIREYNDFIKISNGKKSFNPKGEYYFGIQEHV